MDTLDYTPNFTPVMMRAIRISLNESLSEFGWTLKRAVSPKANYPYSKTYIKLLEMGAKPITPIIDAGLMNIAGALDDMPASLAGAVKIEIYARPGQVRAGAFLPMAGQVAKCARPGCPVWFIKINPAQKYHDPTCRP